MKKITVFLTALACVFSFANVSMASNKKCQNKLHKY